MPKRNPVKKKRVRVDAEFVSPRRRSSVTESVYHMGLMADALSHSTVDDLERIRSLMSRIAADDEFWERLRAMQARERARREDVTELQKFIKRKFHAR